MAKSKQKNNNPNDTAGEPVCTSCKQPTYGVPGEDCTTPDTHVTDIGTLAMRAFGQWKDSGQEAKDNEEGARVSRRFL